MISYSEGGFGQGMTHTMRVALVRGWSHNSEGGFGQGMISYNEGGLGGLGQGMIS